MKNKLDVQWLVPLLPIEPHTAHR
eukprot:COSAG05_NODE_21672_length_270_cov_0.608187_1_plen_23_part_01